MDTANFDDDIVRRADSFLWLCAENADAGARNGRKLGQLAINSDAPIARYDSMRSSESAKSLKPDEFRGLRTVKHLALGSPVMLTSDKIYGVEAVLPGLMNGARGVVVGLRHSPGSAPPHLPDYVVVENSLGVAAARYFEAVAARNGPPLHSLRLMGRRGRICRVSECR